MTDSNDYSFPRYLSSKKSVDDRALNKHVWNTLTNSLPQVTPDRPLQILEIGAGIGTMLERMLDWAFLTWADYTAIDDQEQNTSVAKERLRSWAIQNGFQATQATNHLTLERKGHQVSVTLETIDLYKFLARERNKRNWDLLIAHAFLDLIDLSTTLPKLFELLPNGGFYYFTLNFDGLTSFEPTIDPDLDELIMTLYHNSMDSRIIGGKRSGDSRTGRHLFGQIKKAGARILDSGASDWVVFPGPQGYVDEEAYFLHFILHTIESELTGYPQLDEVEFSTWIAERHAQVMRGELVYIAHQLDFAGKVP